jgi:preprotein translocase subunit SecY
MAQIANMARIPELRKRLLFTFFMIAVYRFGVHVPTPGIDVVAIKQFFASQKGTLLEMFNLFSGGALQRFSIFALGVMPYISSSIIMQLLTVVFPALERLQKEGEHGRRKINQYSRYLTVLLSIVQGWGIATFLEHQQGVAGASLVLDPGLWFKIQTVLTLAAGTIFIMVNKFQIVVLVTVFLLLFFRGLLRAFQQL